MDAPFEWPRGVPKETDQQATAAFEDYRGTLSTQAPGVSGAARTFQVQVAGSTEYKISGNGESVWADGLDPKSGQVIEAKYSSGDRSPFISGANMPDDIRTKIQLKEDEEFYRYSQVISCSDKPLLGFNVVTNDSRAVSYFESLLARYNIPGKVTVLPFKG